MKEMVGGCCVCSDERGWQENPLVYCDGQDCSVAVHQACYGIVSVPTGPWYCEKCVSGDSSSGRFRCDLCPMREGALKRTDKNGWAHVVCALYIPEVRFGNVTTMDPIILSQVPPERFNKVCYICEEKGSSEKAKVGACMQCNKNGCKACFHVTCAQQEGLLCEESGIQDNIKYCGYCSHHFKKLRKDPLIKAIPPYRPIVSASSSVSSTTIGSTNKERSPINNNKNVSAAGGNLSNVHNSNNNNNHHSTNQRENCIKPSVNTPKLPATPTPPAPNSNSAVVSTATATVTVVSVASNQLRPSTAVATSGIYIPIQATALSSVSGTGPSLAPSLPQPLPSIPRPLVAVDGGSETASSPWTKPVPQISYLGFNNDILHSNTSGHVVGGATSVNAMVPASTVAAASITGPGIGTLTPMAAISSVIPPSGFALKNPPTFAGNNGSTTSNPTRTTTVPIQPASTAPVEAPTTAPAPTATVQAAQATAKSKVPSASTADRKRKSESKEPGAVVAGNGEPPGDKPKKRRTSTKKTVKSLLELVSPVVEDTVSSFQREKVASQRSEMFQQQLHQQLQHQQHQQSSIDSVIAATAAGHQSTSQAPAVAPPERPSLPAAATAAMVPEVIEQPPLAIPVANIIAPPPPPKSAPFRSPQDASSLAGATAFPTSLEQLLERQWEQGSQFLMEQAQHFDIASLLSCLHQLKMENQRLEDHVVSLAGRRDHLLAVNARLSLSLGQQHQSPNSPRISTVAPVATPFLHLQAPNSQDSSHDTSENSASSRLSAPPNTSTPIALHQPFVGATIVPVVTTTSKAMQTPTTATSSSIVVSPTNRTALGSLTAAVASPNFAMLPGGSGVGGSVFSSVKNKPSQEPSPDRQQAQPQQQAPGSFLIPRAPTPLLATDLVRPQSSLVSNQYPVSQDPHQRMFYQLMQQNALAAAYGNAFSSLMQSTSPHRAAAAVLAQSHLAPHTAGAPPAPSSQEKS